ncbi:MAG: hypothetical protein JSW54_08285 [Fidelibacterota bacterium]|nr:MAG: hypothetical protein JSW54_08285 [Candidatus Neomarinimicrobiota bacterium]
MALLWTRNRLRESQVQRLPAVEVMIFISQRLVTVTSSVMLLAGVLLIVDQPAILSIGGLLHVKIFLGVLLVAGSHVSLAKMKKSRAALLEGRVDGKSERYLDLTTWIIPALTFVVMFLGVMVTHG